MSEAQQAKNDVAAESTSDAADPTAVTWVPEVDEVEATPAAWGGAGAEAGQSDDAAGSDVPGAAAGEVSSTSDATSTPDRAHGAAPKGDVTEAPAAPGPAQPAPTPSAPTSPAPAAPVRARHEQEAFTRLPGDTATSVLARVNVEVAEKRRMEWTVQRRTIVVLMVAGLALLVGGVTAVLTPGCWLAAAILAWLWKMRPLVRWSTTVLCSISYFAMFVLVGAMMHR